MTIIEEARELVKNNQLTESELLTSFNIIGNEYLNGENAFLNNDNGLINLTYEFDVSREELLMFLRRSYSDGSYHPNDRYVSFDGGEIVSWSTINYFKDLLVQKMDGNCAEYILSLH